MGRVSGLLWATRARLALAAVLLATATVPSTADAQVDDATRGAARTMGQEGLDAYDAGRYGEAVEKLGAAYAAAPVPALGLWLARALAKSGQLVEASERYGEVTRLKVQPGQDEDTQRQAQADAETERSALLPRIPNLRVQIKGADPSSVEITVDGAKLPSSLLAAPRPTNPGERIVEGKLGTQVVTQRVTLGEGETCTVVLAFTAEPAAAALLAPAPAAEPPVSSSPPGPAQPLDAGTARGSPQHALGYVGLGVGGVGIVVGAVSGLVALGKKGKLEDDGCVDGHCFPSQQSDVDAYNSTLTVSTVGFIVGGVGLAAGVSLLLAAPRARENVALSIGPGSVAVRGRF